MYNPETDYSSITDEYPTHSYSIWEPGDTLWLAYDFAWFHFNPWPDHNYDSENWISFNGHTYESVDRGSYESHPTQCPCPCLPPLQGPPPPSQKWWSYPGYDTYSVPIRVNSDDVPF